MGKDFHAELEESIDEYIHRVYLVSKRFPQEEVFGATSQFRRAALSIMLNYVEGYARNSSKAEHVRFLRVAYGSLKETTYLIQFSFKQEWLNEKDKKELEQLADKIGRMLWGTIKKRRD